MESDLCCLSCLRYIAIQYETDAFDDGLGLACMHTVPEQGGICMARAEGEREFH